MKDFEVEFYKQAGDCLKRNRLLSGKSDHEVAEALGVNVSFIRNIEAGRYKVSFIQLQRYAKSIGMSGILFTENGLKGVREV